MINGTEVQTKIFHIRSLELDNRERGFLASNAWIYQESTIGSLDEWSEEAENNSVIHCPRRKFQSVSISGTSQAWCLVKEEPRVLHQMEEVWRGSRQPL